MYKALAPTMPSYKQLTQKCVSKENQLNQTESSSGNFSVKFMFCKNQGGNKEVECTGTNIDEFRKKLMDRA